MEIDTESYSLPGWIRVADIKTEDGKSYSFKNHMFMFDVLREMSKLEKNLVIYKAAQIGFCLSPDTKILTTNYEWKEIDSLLVGDGVIAVDEHSKGQSQGRKKRVGVIERKTEVFEGAFKLTLSNGVTLIATDRHRFLSKKRGATDTVWREVGDFRVGDTVRYFCDVWEKGDYEDGWMGGMIDGEGSLRHKSGTELTIVQSEGAVFDRLVEYFRLKGYINRITKRGKNRKGLGTKTVWDITTSNTAEIYKIIGQTRPSRFVNRTDWWEGSGIGRNKNGLAWLNVINIEPLGKRRMIDIQTSTKTFIAEGIVSHNSTAAILATIWIAKNKLIDIIYTLPTANDVKDFVGGKINRIIAQNECLRNWVKHHDTIEQKSVGDNIIYYRGTTMEKAAMMMTSQLNVFDEIDASNQRVIEQYSTRQQGPGETRIEWYFSHPSVEGNGVSRHWPKSDQKHWFIICGECKEEQFMSWPESFDMMKRIYACKSCNAEISDSMRRKGRWVAKYNKCKHCQLTKREHARN